MPYHDDERRRTGPFGYPLDDSAALTLEEREATQGTTPPAIADPGQQAEYTELNSRIAEAESALAANEALADSQERDLRYEGVPGGRGVWDMAPRPPVARSRPPAGA